MARTQLHTLCTWLAAGRYTEIAQGACAISRLRKASYAIPRMVCKLRIPRLRYAISRLLDAWNIYIYSATKNVTFSQNHNSEVQAGTERYSYKSHTSMF